MKIWQCPLVFFARCYPLSNVPVSAEYFYFLLLIAKVGENQHRPCEKHNTIQNFLGMNRSEGCMMYEIHLF